MANTYLTRTQSANETDSKKATISVWLKLSAVEGNYSMGVFGSHVSGDYNANGNGQIGFYNGGLYAWWKTGGSTYYKQESTRRFRDTNAWYHVVYRYDTTQSSGDDRIRVYVNGEEITSWVAVNDPPQNANIEINNGGRIIRVGTFNYLNGTPNYFNGSMSHYHFCDGYSYAPTEFGSTDATTGEWKINTSPNVSYGTNGFLILKDGNTITDQSSNSNDFSAGAGTLTKTEDNPSNVFATLNPLSGADTMAVNTTFSNGNNTVVCSGTVYNAFGTTLGVNKGKWYAEFKLKSAAADGMIGIFAKYGASGNYLGSQAYQYCWYNDSGRIIGNNANIQTGVGQYTTNDIIGIALDCDNNKLYFHKNGTYISNGSGTGDPTNGNYGISITDPDDTDLGFYFMSAMDWGGSIRGNWSANFGNGYFGTTAVSSAGTNASGNGIFEYDVPTGYTALSTKGLNL